MHKKLFEEYGLFDENLHVCEDYDMWLRIASVEEIKLINEKLINKYAGHDEQLGFTKNMENYRIVILENLIKKCRSKEKKNLMQKELQEKILNKIKVQKR